MKLGQGVRAREESSMPDFKYSVRSLALLPGSNEFQLVPILMWYSEKSWAIKKQSHSAHALEMGTTDHNDSTSICNTVPE